MDTLDRTTFENGMRQLMQRLDKHEAVLNVINESGRDMMSKRTLQRYRSSGMIPYRLLKRKPYYKRSDVEDFIRTYAKEIKKENDGNRKARIYV